MWFGYSWKSIGQHIIKFRSLCPNSFFIAWQQKLFFFVSFRCHYFANFFFHISSFFPEYSVFCTHINMPCTLFFILTFFFYGNNVGDNWINDTNDSTSINICENVFSAFSVQAQHIIYIAMREKECNETVANAHSTWNVCVFHFSFNAN